jgi:hypothetical protein
LGLNAGPFSSPSTQNPTIPVNGHHPAPNPFLHTATNMPNQSAQPEVGKTLKLCKSNAIFFWRYITCKTCRHNLKLGKN